MVDAAKAQIKVKRDIHALSDKILIQFRDKWRCIKCNQELRHFPSSDYFPYILHCGHYICKKCKNDKADSITKNAFTCKADHFQYKDGIIPESETPYEKINLLKPALHIIEILSLYGKRGIECAECKKAPITEQPTGDVPSQISIGESRTNMTACSDAAINCVKKVGGAFAPMSNDAAALFFIQETKRYPRERMLVYLSTLTEEKVNELRNVKDIDSLNKYEEDNQVKLSENIMCDSCLEKKHRANIVDMRRVIGISYIPGLIEKMNDGQKDWDKKLLTKEEQDEKNPRNLEELPISVLGKVIEPLLKCRKCGIPFVHFKGIEENLDVIPTFVSCGHILCTLCEIKILRDPDEMKDCGFQKCNIKLTRQEKTVIASDLAEITFQLDSEQFRRCEECHYRLHEDQLMRTRNGPCIFCFFRGDPTFPP